MAKSAQATPQVETTTYETAMETLAAAERTVLDARKRLVERQETAARLDSEAAEADRQRGTALARGELDQAAELGKKFAIASDGAKDAHRAAKAMSDSLDGLLFAVFEAEDAADTAHARNMNIYHDVERARLVEQLRYDAVRCWRASTAAGHGLPFRLWWDALGDDVNMGNAANAALDDSLPIPALNPRSALIGGNPRRPLGMMSLRAKLISMHEQREVERREQESRRTPTAAEFAEQAA